METILQILIVEETLADVVLINSELRKAGLNFHSKRVETKEGFVAELLNEPPDIILCNHDLPKFDGFAALEVAKKYCPDVPFVFVTGLLGEEMVAESFRRGASDYWFKYKLFELAPTITRAIRMARERWMELEKAKAEKEVARELAAEVMKIERIKNLLPICTACKKIRDTKGEWHSVEDFLAHHLGVTFTHGVCPDCVDKLYPSIHLPKVSSK